MATIVDLMQWRLRQRDRPRGTGASEAGEADEGMDRLDRAVDRLSALVAGRLDATGRVERRVETELLAIIGELTMGLVGEAAGRAERLAKRLERTG